MTETGYKKKLEFLEDRLGKFRNLAIAFSGGVDSTFLLAVVKKTNPVKLIAITVSSRFVPEREIEFARKTALSLGVDHIILDADILGNNEVVKNTKDRCYHCKKQTFSLIRDAAQNEGITSLFHAVNQDDLKDFRPGLKAAEELGFLSPLAEAGFTKKEIRECSFRLGLETWNKPTQSCLATRIPYHVRITQTDLMRVDLAEAYLQGLGFTQVRVRCQGDTALIEVEPDRVRAVLRDDVHRKIQNKLKEFGFEKINIDSEGYKTGKMNHEIF